MARADVPTEREEFGASFLFVTQSLVGRPLSEEFPEVNPTDGKIYTVQYFERNRFEYHPEFAGTPNEVLLGLLGVDELRTRGWLP